MLAASVCFPDVTIVFTKKTTAQTPIKHLKNKIPLRKGGGHTIKLFWNESTFLQTNFRFKFSQG
jgi:hypothetical protein